MGDIVRSCDLRNQDFLREKIVYEKYAPILLIYVTKILKTLKFFVHFFRRKVLFRLFPAPTPDQEKWEFILLHLRERTCILLQYFLQPNSLHFQMVPVE